MKRMVCSLHTNWLVWGFGVVYSRSTRPTFLEACLGPWCVTLAFVPDRPSVVEEDAPWTPPAPEWSEQLVSRRVH